MSLATLSIAIVLAIAPARQDAAPKEDLKPTLGAKPPAGATVLFDGSGLEGWTGYADGGGTANWPVADEILTVGKGPIAFLKPVGSYKLHLEFNVPYMPDQTGQGRGNSGVYIHGRYEVQVLDSYGLKAQDNDCAAIYKQHAPKVNACLPPLRWQSYDITFHAPRLDGDKVAKKARITVVHNGVTVIDDAEIEPTPGGTDVENQAEGAALLLQDHGNPVQFRNIWIEPITD